MPVHDWTRVDAGTFHDFHHSWTGPIRSALNRGVLPGEYYARSEQVASNVGPDVLTLQRPQPSNGNPVASRPGGTASVATLAPPQTSITCRAEMSEYTARQRSVVIRHSRGHRIVALVEIVSPGNKASEYAFSTFITKIAGALHRGIHVLVLDLLPTTTRDPNGIHAAIWAAIRAGEFVPPPGRPLTLVSYEAGPIPKAYVEPIAVGSALPAMPLFLEPDLYVRVPLESTYQETWEGMPSLFREELEGPQSTP
jgi:hypothetical protein